MASSKCPESSDNSVLRPCCYGLRFSMASQSGTEEASNLPEEKEGDDPESVDMVGQENFYKQVRSPAYNFWEVWATPLSFYPSYFFSEWSQATSLSCYPSHFFSERSERPPFHFNIPISFLRGYSAPLSFLPSPFFSERSERPTCNFTPPISFLRGLSDPLVFYFYLSHFSSIS